MILINDKITLHSLIKYISDRSFKPCSISLILCLAGIALAHIISKILLLLYNRLNCVDNILWRNCCSSSSCAADLALYLFPILCQNYLLFHLNEIIHNISRCKNYNLNYIKLSSLCCCFLNMNIVNISSISTKVSPVTN